MSTESVAALDVSVSSRGTTRPAAQWRDRPNDWFYFCSAWLVAAAVAYGFSHTVSQNLLRATPPRPRILWIHAGVFCAWVGVFLLQTALWVEFAQGLIA
jgi:hypothetical protein